MVPTGNMKYSPEFFYIGAGFTGAFLLRLLHPSLSNVVDRAKRQKIVHTAQRLITSLNSENVSIDEEHTPRQYATFLTELSQSMKALWTPEGKAKAQEQGQGQGQGQRVNGDANVGRESRVQEVAC